MKTSILLLTIIFTFQQMAHAQKDDFTQYYELTIQARELLDKQDYSAAIKASELSFSLVDCPASRDLEKAVEIALKMKDTLLVKKYCRTMAEIYGIIPSAKTIEDENFLQSLQNEFATEIALAESQRDQFYISLLDSLGNEDQAIRQNGAFEYINGIDSDSLRTVHLLSLIKVRGFPEERKVGKWGYNNAMRIFIHADFDLKNELLGKLMLDNVMNGNMDPMDYAHIIDRRFNFRGERPYYNQVPFGYDKLTDLQKKDISERRRKIGLRSVEESMAIETLPNGDLRASYKY
ncbi:MAG: hypothetical protein IPP89_03105 [Saprospiraceae bacterium]|nr:hypothetical protein [Candidatus Brachybacter algidus]MBL0117976.1 hypothetical protein [Candidatus Brachybacter algidus]